MKHTTPTLHLAMHSNSRTDIRIDCSYKNLLALDTRGACEPVSGTVEKLYQQNSDVFALIRLPTETRLNKVVLVRVGGSTWESIHGRFSHLTTAA